MILIPGTTHQITWSIQNLSDTTTYYVKAVIRDVRTETTLATVLLTNLGNGRFSKSWNVPQDGSGFGREIEIEKTIYEDAAYTVPSGTYGRWLDNHTIFNLGTRNSSTGGYGNAGSQVDYREIAKIIKIEVDNAVKTLLEAEMNEDAEDSKETDLSGVTGGLQSVLSGLAGISVRLSRLEDAHASSEASVETISGTVEKIESSLLGELNRSVVSMTEEIQSQLSIIKEGILTIKEDSDKTKTVTEKKTEKKFQEMLGRLKTLITVEGQRVSNHISETMTKPLNVVLAASVNKQEEKGPSAREIKIQNLLTHA